MSARGQLAYTAVLIALAVVALGSYYVYVRAPVTTEGVRLVAFRGNYDAGWPVDLKLIHSQAGGIWAEPRASIGQGRYHDIVRRRFYLEDPPAKAHQTLEHLVRKVPHSLGAAAILPYSGELHQGEDAPGFQIGYVSIPQKEYQVAFVTAGSARTWLQGGAIASRLQTVVTVEYWLPPTRPPDSSEGS